MKQIKINYLIDRILSSLASEKDYVDTELSDIPGFNLPILEYRFKENLEAHEDYPIVEIGISYVYSRVSASDTNLDLSSLESAYLIGDSVVREVSGNYRVYKQETPGKPGKKINVYISKWKDGQEIPNSRIVQREEVLSPAEATVRTYHVYQTIDKAGLPSEE